MCSPKTPKIVVPPAPGPVVPPIPPPIPAQSATAPAPGLLQAQTAAAQLGTGQFLVPIQSVNIPGGG